MVERRPWLDFLSHAVLIVGVIGIAFPVYVTFVASTLTLEQIMADTDWLGNAPENSFWGADNKTVYYQQKRQASELRDLFTVDSNDGTTSQVAEAEWSQRLHTSITYNQAGDRRAYVYRDDIYLLDASGPRQLTRTAAKESAPLFMSDGRRVAFVMLVNHANAGKAHAAQQALLEWVWVDLPMLPAAPAP